MIETNHIEKRLKGLIGKKVKILICAEVQAEENPFIDPVQKNLTETVFFEGIYGLNGNPMYIYSIDDYGKEKIFRNALNIWQEVKGEDRTILKMIGEIKIEEWFERYFFEEDVLEFKKKVRFLRPDENYLAERILNGDPDYSPNRREKKCKIIARHSISDKKFIREVLFFLEKII